MQSLLQGFAVAQAQGVTPESDLDEKIRLRDPYVTPLNVLQVRGPRGIRGSTGHRAEYCMVHSAGVELSDRRGRGGVSRWNWKMSSGGLLSSNVAQQGCTAARATAPLKLPGSCQVCHHASSYPASLATICKSTPKGARKRGKPGSLPDVDPPMCACRQA